MLTIAEKIPTINESDGGSIEDDVFFLSEKLYQQDEEAYTTLLIRLAERLSPAAKRELRQTLRSPLNAFGILAGHPLWPEVDAAIERHRQQEADEYAKGSEEAE